MFLSFISNWTWGDSSTLGPGMFSWFHILWIIVCIALCVLFAFLGKKEHDKKKDDIIILSFAIGLTVLEILKQYLYHFDFYGYLRIDILPFAFCSVPLYFAWIGSLVRNEKVKDICYKFLSFFGLIGGVAFMIFPESLNTYFVFISFHTMIWHSSLVIMGVYLISSRGYGISFKKEVIPPFIAFLCCLVLAVIANETIYHAYLYQYDEPIIKVDREPGSYTPLLYGFYDEGNTKYYYFSKTGGELKITDEFLDADDVVITYSDSDNGYILNIDYFDDNKYLEMVKEGDKITYKLSDEETMGYSFVYISSDHAVMGHEFDGVDYIFALTKENELKVIAKDEYNEENYLVADFLEGAYFHEGDAANFFFVSNHAKTPIPVLDLIQENAPYPVFLLTYIAGVFGLASATYGISKAIRKTSKKK